MRWIVLLSIALLLPVAAAQGPAPGHDSALDYAEDYAGDQAAAAADDPVGYAVDHASKEALGAEVGHTAYMACWAADDAGIQHEACDPYYTPRGHADPEQPAAEPEPAVQETEYLVNEAVDATDDLLEEGVDAVEGLADDPSGVAAFVARMADATGGFLQRIADAVTGFAAGIGDMLGQLGALGPLAADVGTAITDGILDGSDAFVHASADLGRVTTAGLADAGRAAGHGVAAGAGAVADAVQDVAAAVHETLAGWFGTESAAVPTEVAPEMPVDVPVDDGGLLDGVTEVLG